MQRFPATLELAGAAIFIAAIIAIPIGVYSAARRGSFLDLFGRGAAVLGQSLPTFWLGLVLIFIFGVWLRVLPVGERSGISNLILPAFVVGSYALAGVTRLTRSSMLDVLGNEYIKLARIKGLSESTVIWKHALKNAVLPVLTFSVLIFVRLLGGTVVTETVFAWPGVGRLMMEAVLNRDFPVIQTGVILLSTAFIIANLVTDILYAYLNPRIRYGK